MKIAVLISALYKFYYYYYIIIIIESVSVAITSFFSDVMPFLMRKLLSFEICHSAYLLLVFP